MNLPPGVRIFSLDDAGQVTVTYEPAGLTISRIDVATGWVVANRFPDGLFSRRRPAHGVGVVLRDGSPQSATREAELEIGRLDDGRWEIAHRHSREGARLDGLDIDGGSISLDWDGVRLEVSEVEAAPGWRLETGAEPSELEGSWDLVVVWTRGDQDVELVVHCQSGEDPPGHGLVEIDRRERVAALG